MIFDNFVSCSDERPGNKLTILKKSNRKIEWSKVKDREREGGGVRERPVKKLVNL